eukprot:TRINITY_DN19177_c0_g1_i1.p1 TRINITY_DN19177_c0_g1~~TRINITY_DN19177_c0_g1_i1.p1  ORF type:complete len:466 (+),score=90.29 TRINITY_DN19177_c0_g1_i1:122-1519(+)
MAEAPPLPRMRLPNLKAASRHGVHAETEEANKDDPLFQPLLRGMSKLYQRRREIQSEFRRDFSLPQEIASDLKKREQHNSQRPQQQQPQQNQYASAAAPSTPSTAAGRRSPSAPASIPQLPRAFPRPLGPAPPIPPIPGRERFLVAGASARAPPLESPSGPKPPPQFPASPQPPSAAASPPRAAASPAPVPVSADERVPSARPQSWRLPRVDRPQHADRETPSRAANPSHQEKRDRFARHLREAEREKRRQREEEDVWEKEIRKRLAEDERQRGMAQNGTAGTGSNEAHPPCSEAEAAAAAAAHAESHRQAQRQEASRTREGPGEFDAEARRNAWMREEAERARQRQRHASEPRRKRRTFAPNGGVFDEGRVPSPKGAAYLQRSLKRTGSLSNLKSQAAEESQKRAEAAVMHELNAVRQLATKKERQKAFKDLLRAWHPDKNPKNVEVATAVFQRLQAERSRVLA